jgi:hypothetical protein
LIFQVPETWNPDQIKNFSLYWEAMLRGNLENRRGAMFVPKGVAPYDTKEKALKDEYDEWLTRICCFAFGVSPTPFIRQMNRATADSHHEAAIQQGLEPVLRWLSNLIDGIIELKFGAPDLCFRWEEDDAIDPQEQATIDVALVGAKIYHPDEIRAKRGDDPMPDAQRAQMDLATFNAAANSTVLPDEQQQAQNDHALAMQAAKPAPVVGPTPEAKKEDEARFEKLMAALKQAPANITVEAPQVHIAPAAVNVTAPPINVTLPEIKQPDVFVDVGPTTVHAKFDSPKPRTVTASRDGHGHLVAKIEE